MDAKNGVYSRGDLLKSVFHDFAKDYGQRLAAAVDALPLDAVEALD